MKFQPQLDGLRGLFVAAVFLFHAQFLDCGWAGVQAFFVLSGYLITGVLLDAKQRGAGAGTFFRNFYARRSLRIFPVYFAFIGAIALVPMLGLGGPDVANAIRAHVAEHVPYLLTYTYNFFRIPNGLGSPFFGHLWSLSIEEQFYLLWPPCIYLLSRERLVGLCKALVVAGPIVRLAEQAWIWHFHPESAGDSGRIVYFLTMSHFDAFALGALINFRTEDALVGRIADWPARRLLLPAGLASAVVVLLAAWSHIPLGASSLGWTIYLPNFGMQVWGYSLLNLVFFMAIVKSRPDGILTGNRAVRRLGKVSYGFYIFHLPVLWIAYGVSGAARGTYSGLNLFASLAAFALTWLLAETSFRLLESPMLRMKDRFG
jgi:peptidoglycan/LPS O-acetylase OafA/YrhL